METEITGSHPEQGIGVDVYDENGYYHWLAIMWDGSVDAHETDDYPHEPEDRTDDEQRIMCQVEERARYAAQQEFPEAEILDPMWDPDHIDRGIEALVNYPIEEFHANFRDYYEALSDPLAYVGESSSNVLDNSFRFFKSYTITPDNRIDEVEDVAISYRTSDREGHTVGPFIEREDEDVITCVNPWLEIDDDFDFEEDFHELLLTHLLAQIRDIYLNMGEQPPTEFKVKGIGKLDIHGDGIGET